MIFVKITLLWCHKNLKKTCTQDVDKAKSKYYYNKKYFFFCWNHRTMMPDNIVKNMRLRCRPGKTILLRYPKNTGMIKNHSTMMPENIEKTMYLSRDEVKITVLWYPKKDFFLIFCLKSHYFDAQKYWCPKKLKKKNMYF